MEKTFLIKKCIGVAVGIVWLSSACSITATRPLQEMSNAEAAIRAAKVLHADSLVPEIFRTASENYFKAKREYRLKNFDLARTYALKATRMAEQAEFKAYQLGGATPEASSKLVNPEGALPDPDQTSQDFSNGNVRNVAPPESNEPEEVKTGESAQSPPPTPDGGTDYNEFVKQQEEKQKQEKEKSEQKKEVPGGQIGPQDPKSVPDEKDEYINHVTTSPDPFPVPQTGGLPSAMPHEYTTKQQPLPPIDKVRRITDQEQRYRDEDLPERSSAEIAPHTPSEIPSLETKSVSEMGHNRAKESGNLEQPTMKNLEDLNSKPISNLYHQKGDSND